MTYYAIDFETANNYQNSACSVGVVRFVDGVEKDSVYSLITMIKIYSEQESEKIEFIHVNGADHNFTACLDLFIELPGVLFFGDELTYKGAKVR